MALMGGAVMAWATFWLVPTEVVGKGVLLLPDNAGLLDARAAGQVRRLPIRVGNRVQRGQVLVELFLPVLEKELEQQRANLRELERQNRALDERDRLRLQSEQGGGHLPGQAPVRSGALRQPARHLLQQAAPA
jgi:HlyD family secretion protein